MPTPADPPRQLDATAPPSAPSHTDETSPGASSAGGGTAAGFGPPAEAGEVGTLGPYRVVRLLGKGGMGAVYAALDTRLGRRLALKVMLPEFAADPAARERFLREARAAAAVSHEHVVTVFEADERQGVPYIAMPYLEGFPLDEYLKKKGNPSLAQAVRLAREAALGLAAAHKHGLVHRDIKPGNLWLEAPQGKVKVLDFGLAKPIDAEVELTKSGAIVGTPAYMSPEQARGEKVDARTDLFSLGAVLYRLVAGRLPFPGQSTMAVLIALGTEEPPPVQILNPKVPDSLAELIHRLLAKDPAARPQTAAEVVRLLRAVAAELETGRPPAAPASPAAPSSSQASQPLVVYVPIAVPEASASPFADIDATEAESAPVVAPAKPRGGVAMRVGIGAAALAALAAVAVAVVVLNRTPEPKPDAPAPPAVVEKDKARPGPKTVPVAGASNPDRAAALWALGIGGTVRLNDEEAYRPATAELPGDPFTLSGVSVAGKAVADADLARLAGLKNFKYLEVYNTPVSDAGLAHLKDTTRLRTASLSGTKVGDAGLLHLANNRSLETLLADKTGLTDGGMATAAGFARLKKLGLSKTGVTDAGLARLGGLRELQSLYLNETAVTDAGLARLHDLKALAFLRVRATKVTAAGLAAFRAAVPGCRVEHDGGVIEPADADRAAAEWAIDRGGWVSVNGAPREIRTAAELPPGRFVVTRLNLCETAATDDDLARLRPLTALTHLWLDGLPVTDAGLAHLAGLKSLTLLGAGDTRIAGDGLVHVAGLPGLEQLGLARTRVTDAALAHLKGHARLTHLWVEDTAATDVGLAHVAALPALAELHANDSGVTDEGLRHLAALPALRVLGVSGTGVTDDGLRHLAAVPTLAVLGLGRTRVTGAGLVHLKNSPRLEVMWLDGSALTDAGLAAARDLPALSFLELMDTGVSDAGLAWLRGHPRLHRLGLHGTTVTDAGVAHLKTCPNLTRISLSHTRLTDAGLAALAADPRPTELLVRATGVTARGLADFRTAVPGCRLFHD